ncbi:MAG: DUF4345 family protein [Leptospirales bacterium]|nr:DUF4345 family protein [Leptospirales bacterium]
MKRIESENQTNGGTFAGSVLARKSYLALNLAVYALFALGFFIAPVTLAGKIGITLQHSAALADLRAVYGGLSLGIGALIVLGLTQKTHTLSAVILCMLASAGLLLGRLVTMILDGPGDIYIYGSMALEVLAVILGVLLIRGRSE